MTYIAYPKRFFYLLVSIILAFFVLFIYGCDEPTDAQANRVSAQSVDEAQRLIRASREEIPLTQTEIEQGAIPGRSKSIARQVVNRLDQKFQAPDPCRIADDIKQFTHNLNLRQDPTAAQKLCDHLNQTLQKMIDYQDKSSQAADETRIQRLKKAQTILQEAVNFSQSHNQPNTRVAPEMMLGSIHLMQARHVSGSLQQRDFDIQTFLFTLSHWFVALDREIAFTRTLEASRPEPSINELQKELSDMQQQFNTTRQGVNSLTEKHTKLNDQLKTQQNKAQQIQDRYLALTEQAESKTGQQRYALLQQAHQLRVGTDQQRGGIHYDALIENTQNELDVITGRLARQKKKHDNLAKSIQAVQDTIKQLQNSPETTSSLDTDIDQSRQVKEKLISLLTKQLTTFKDLDNSYQQLLSSSESALKDALKSYKNASQAARQAGRDMLKSSEYAKDLNENIVKYELANLWINCARHYQALADTLSRFPEIPETRSQITSLISAYKSQASDALKTADQYRPPVKPQAAPKSKPTSTPAPAPAPAPKKS